MKNFRYILIIVSTFCMLQSCIVSEKPNIEFFANKDYDFEDAKFASFNVPLFLAKPYIKRALREDGENEEAVRMISKVSGIKLMTVANANEKMLKDYASYLKGENYEDWATIKHDGENVNIRVKQSGETIKKMLITVNSKAEMVFVDVKGNFTADDISKIINAATDK